MGQDTAQLMIRMACYLAIRGNIHLYVCFAHTWWTKVFLLSLWWNIQIFDSIFFLQCIMSNHGTASQKQTKSQNTPRRCSSSTSLDEEVKIAVNLSLERFRYSDQKGNNVFIVLYQKLKAELFSLAVFVKLVIVLHVWMRIVTCGFKQCWCRYWDCLSIPILQNALIDTALIN